MYYLTILWYLMKNLSILLRTEIGIENLNLFLIVVGVSTATTGWGAIPTGAVAGAVYESTIEIIAIMITE